MKRIKNWFYINSSYGFRDWVHYAWISIVTVVVLGLLVGGCYKLQIRFARQKCQAYSERTLRDAELVNTTFLSWECFVKVDGQWVLRDQVWDNGDKP